MKAILIFLFCVLSLRAVSQLPDYYVYLVTGDATIGKAGAAPSAVKQKQLVYKTDIIKLKAGAEVTLVDREASFFVLNAAGSYKASDLTKKIAAQKNDGITVKYLKLLFHELLDPNQDFEKFKKENIAGVWGGVSRSDNCGNRIFPVNGLKTSAVSIVFRWHKTSPSSDYSFSIYDKDGNELSKSNIKDTLISVNTSEVLQGRQGKYFWRVISKDGNCEDEVPIYFEILTPENEQKQAEQLINPQDKSVEAVLQQIDKLEKNAFIHMASVKYAGLVNDNPDNKALMKSYVIFLLKYGFDEQARSVWKP